MLKKERTKKRLTQEELAGQTGIDPRTILRIEKDFTIPKIDTYAKIVVALEMTDEEIGKHVRKIALNNKRKEV